MSGVFAVIISRKWFAVTMFSMKMARMKVGFCEITQLEKFSDEEVFVAFCRLLSVVKAEIFLIGGMCGVVVFLVFVVRSNRLESL